LGKVKIISVVGARPQFIKAAAVSRIISDTKDVEEVLVHTGQHYDDNMSAIFFGELEIPKPIKYLGIGSGLHGEQTGRMLKAIERVIIEEKPSWVLVYGDTNSTLAGALAAAKLHIPLAHIEAGLRSHNRRMPEEINRVLTDHASDLLFAPTRTAVENLRREGIPDERVYLVGDVMYDACIYYAGKSERESKILKSLQLEPKSFLLTTIHRAENTDTESRLRLIFKGLCEIAGQLRIILPLHPRTREALEEFGMLDQVSGTIKIIDPVGYLDMITLEKNAKIIATDSGGVQKEAYFFHVPCITFREETEWKELVEHDWNRLIPLENGEEVINKLQEAISSKPPASPIDGELFGNGNASSLIVNTLMDLGC
jgi:UDP-GlcNAc3NAcA epimerase